MLKALFSFYPPRLAFHIHFFSKIVFEAGKIKPEMDERGLEKAGFFRFYVIALLLALLVFHLSFNCEKFVVLINDRNFGF